MENEVYEKDYGEEFRERSDKSKGKDFLDTLMEAGFFQKYQEEMDKIPKRAKNVTFLMKDGLLRMTVFIGYFECPCRREYGSG